MINDCSHKEMNWKTSSAEELENTILKPDAVKAIFGSSLKVHYGECDLCNRTVIEICHY